MGPALVATMVHAEFDGPAVKKVHPFFNRAPDALSEDSPTFVTTTTPNALLDDASTPPGSDREGSNSKRTIDTPSTIGIPAAKKQRREGESIQHDLNGTITDHFPQPGHAKSYPRAMEPAKRILTPPPNETFTATDQEGTKIIAPVSVPAPAPAPAPVLLSSPMPQQSSAATDQGSGSANKKILKFNPKTGTLGSPPKPKRGKSYHVTIKYGRDEENRKAIGETISQILEGTYEPAKTTKDKGRRKARAPKSDGFMKNKKITPPKVSGQVDQAPKKSPAQKQTISMVTPVSPRRQRNPFAPVNVTNFGGMKPVGTKVPGAKHPAWPGQGMAHVRGIDPADVYEPEPITAVDQNRKSKGQTIQINQEDSVLADLASRLRIQEERAACHDAPGSAAEFPPPPELRLPIRRFESGRQLQGRLRPQLVSLRTSRGSGDPDIGMDELYDFQPPRSIHPAVSSLYTQLEHTLSAYDRSTCESHAWTHKYSPATASQVLQAGKEAFYLKDWLEMLKVQSVDTGVADSSAKSKDKSDRAPKKRRKNKLDGFIVDSDEDDDFEEASDDDADWAPAGPGRRLKTVIRRSRTKGQRKLPNAVVLSGPHGSGKTAAVYAVAKELGFEVFEINSSNRRSGKDLLEKVGDMTRNHLVQQHHADTPTSPADGDDGLNSDIKSGKQGMMTSFFKPKTGVPPKKVSQEKLAKAKSDTRPASKSQKQSLILLEEVDILYEEDKQFFTTLLDLMAQSKRPFVLTCNDETLIPIQIMNLYGILRFSPPPAVLATDVCLLIAANEGHALQRPAVEALFQARGNDLRATITELNYWCQIGVGDRRGGFDWFYLRWPKGSDIDAKGDVVRVISDDTYVKGMGWVARDDIATSRPPLPKEEEAMRQCSDHWEVDVGDWHKSLNMPGCVDAMNNEALRANRLADLKAYEDFCETLSLSDVISNGSFGGMLDDQICCDLPQMPTKMRDDFVIGRKLLEADPVVDQHPLSQRIAISLASLARAGLQTHAIQAGEQQAGAHLGHVSEDKAISILESSFKSYKMDMGLTRLDMAFAFDPIAVSDNEVQAAHLTPSVFDRTLKLIVLDVAPWVRSIVSYDQELMHERKKLSSLLSESGQNKRMRNTRSAFSALEGGERRSTRRGKYFEGSINDNLVLRTGLKEWLDASKDTLQRNQEIATVPTPDTMDMDPM